MEEALGKLYFRVRDNGATVFRVDAENRQRRLELDQLATVNLRKGVVRANGDREITPEEMAAIEGWIDARKATLAQRDVDDLWRCVDYLNQTAHLIQTRADDDAADEATDALLMAMHDLRMVLVRKKAERLAEQG